MSADQINALISFGSLSIAFLALGVAVLSWRASVQGNRAALYEHRYAIYADAEKFLGAWARDGRPDMDILPILVGAWSRSQFLCRAAVTDYLRELWTDAVAADTYYKAMTGQFGDRRQQGAAEKVGELFEKHANFDKLRDVFIRDLKVRS